MTRPADPRGADRRKPSTFGAETGYDQPDAGPRRQRWDHRPHRPAPQNHGCRMYEVAGIVYTRCERHRPAGSIDLGAVRGACVACSVSQ